MKRENVRSMGLLPSITRDVIIERGKGQPSLATKFLFEIELQCALTEQSFSELSAFVVSPQISNLEAFHKCHIFLMCAAAVSKLVFFQSVKEPQVRARMRAVLGADEKSPLYNRKARDYLEHIAPHLLQFAIRKRPQGFWITGDRHVGNGPPPDRIMFQGRECRAEFERYLDRDSMKLHLFGNVYDLNMLDLEIRRMRSLARQELEQLSRDATLKPDPFPLIEQ